MGLPIFIITMSHPDFHEAARVFARSRWPAGAADTVPLTGQPVQGGLINHSFKITLPAHASFFLQLINQHVFKNPVAVQENYVSIWSYAQNQKAPVALPEPLFYAPGQSLYTDQQGNYWRAFDFIEEGVTRYIAASPRESYMTARTFGSLTASFNNFPAGELHRVIPDFHNLSFRYSQFENALTRAKEARKNEAASMIRELLDRKAYKDFYDALQQHPTRYKVRVMHHDAKIANVLFHNRTGEVICAVDFDTVMPGFFFSDLGDLVRSMACNLDESSTDFNAIRVRPEYYESILEGYGSVMNELLTDEEKKHIHHAGILMIYMQALRFLSDYLEEDRYYRIQYPEQNKDRAYNQICLLKSLEAYLRSQHHYDLGVAD